MKIHSRLFLLIGILALCLPALLLACSGEEPTGSTPAVGSRSTEAAGSGNGGSVRTPSTLESGDAPNATDAPRPATATPPTTATDAARPATPTAPTTATGSAETDREALVEFYEATNGDSWTDNDGWLSDSPIGQWYGVTADAFGRVTALDLNGNNLVGTVPPELRALTALARLDLGGNRLDGCLPANLYAQDQLDVRALGRAPNPPPAQTSPETDKDALLAIFNTTGGDSWDGSGTWAGRAPIGEWAGVTTEEDGRVVALNVNLGGAEIPPEVGHLTGLTTLTLSGVSGALPPEFGYLENLTGLHLGGSELSGEIPPELGILDSLQSLDLSNNRLCGKLPPELGGLANLTGLNLGGNQLSGRIPPELGSLDSLQVLNLEGNQLTGGIPPELGSLDSLQVLNLEGNQLTGEIPLALDNLAFTMVMEIRLDGNQLGGCITDFLRDGVRIGYGEIPVCAPEDHPGDTEALIALHNAWGQPSLENWLSREPIGEWSGVSVDATGRVAALSLANAGLTGELPPELGSLAGLRYLNLADNQLTGELPPELGSLAGLRHLNLADNQLTGELPPELGHLSSLEQVDLNYNGLIGEIPPELSGLWTDLRSRISGTNIWIGVKWASVSAGEAHNCGVRVDGSVACWGYDHFGQATPPDGEFASVSAGTSYTCGVKRDGSVACWGDNIQGQSTPPEGEFASVSARFHHTCGVRADGSVACWGYDRFGQATPPDGEFASVSAGDDHTCGLRVNGSVACWGSDSSGRSTPPEGEFASVSAGLAHTCGVRVDGSVACWGSDSSGRSTPPEGEFASVSARIYHTCGVRADGSVACWGSDGQSTPPEGEFASVSAGGAHTCGLRADGFVACWGSDLDGQATPWSGSGGGSGSTSGSTQPAPAVPDNSGDRAVLQAVYQATGGPSWSNSASNNWLSEKPMGEWAGVTTEGGYVTHIALASNNLTGQIPDRLGHLTRLQSANLRGNDLTGCIPHGPRLRSALSQSYNAGRGPGKVPGWDLIILQAINDVLIDYNGLELLRDPEISLGWSDFLDQTHGLGLSPCPPPAPTAGLVGYDRQNATSDRRALLAIRDHFISNGTPAGEFKSWQGDMQSDSGVGPLRSGWRGVSLNSQGRVEKLSLDERSLQGDIPAALGSLGQLVELNLSKNEISGPVPAALANLRHLRLLALNQNFTPKGTGSPQDGLSGRLPPELGHLGELRRLVLDDNPFLTGQLPLELGNLTNLEYIHIQDTGFSGCLPPPIRQNFSPTLGSLINKLVQGLTVDQIKALAKTKVERAIKAQGAAEDVDDILAHYDQSLQPADALRPAQPDADRRLPRPAGRLHRHLDQARLHPVQPGQRAAHLLGKSS